MSSPAFQIENKPAAKPIGLDQALLDGIDIEANLRANSLPGIKLSERRLQDYSLSLLTHGSMLSTGYAEDLHNTSQGCVYPIQLHDGNFYRIYINARKAIALNYKSVPNAVVALSASGGEETMITQIQGVRPYRDVDMIGRRRSSRGLAPLEWSGLMVDISEEAAQRLGASAMSIGTASTIKGHHANGTLDYARAVRIYDDTAQAKGYTRGKHYWRKEL